MKFSEIPYTRPDFDLASKRLSEITESIKDASTASEILELYREADRISEHLNTLTTICYIRSSIDTRDKFYEAEQEYIDNQYPLLMGKIQDLQIALAKTPFRPELEKALGTLLFKNLEMQLKSFSPEIIQLMQEENALATEYQKLYASARVPFMGKELTIAQLGPYKQDTNRATRKAAFEAEGSFFDKHREEFDTIFDKLVKNRDKQAKTLGFSSFVELGALRRQRNSYTVSDIASFRDRVVRDLVPLAVKIKKRQAKRLGITDMKFYDNGLKFKDGSAKPCGTPEEILAAGKKMYEELSPDTADFINLMFDNELFDVLAKEGKAPGGYCAGLDEYGYPFIFSNFNGTSGDVDVLTHEAGHAFADYISHKTIDIPDLRHPTMDGAETHSMSMEFLTAPWHHLFFGDTTDKYELTHAEDALTFIPYGCLVDHFQQAIYENPDMDPDQRNKCWAELWNRYIPDTDFDSLPFYGRGAGWQRQLHIYTSPFYYIDYCMAQVMSLQFFALANENREEAWKKYMAFVSLGGTETFTELAHSVGLRSPLDEGCLKDVCVKTYEWTEAHLTE